MPRIVRILLPLLLLALASGCASKLRVTPHEYAHMLCVDPDGRTLPLLVGKETQPRANFDRQIQAIVDGIGDRKHVLIYIHGGLVSLDKAVHAAKRDLAKFSDEDPYPIFVNWETGMFTSYADHLVRIRHGRAEPLRAAVTIPFVLLADFGAALARLPITLWNQSSKGLAELFVPNQPEPRPQDWEASAWVDRQGEARSAAEQTELFVTALIPGIARILTTPLLDAIGLPAFRNMERRARVLFLWDSDFDSKERQLSGALSRLMRALQPRAGEGGATSLQAAAAKLHNLRQQHALHGCERMRGDAEPRACASLERQIAEERERLAQIDGRDDAFRITLVAHSMGTMVANELIRRHPEFIYETIVFMGAACSIKDFADTTLVYVMQHEFTHFYSLTLHPESESNDRYGYGFFPHGSLLDWIDSYVVNQKSELDRTLGKWDNVMRVLPVIDDLSDDVRQRISIRGFGREPADQPRDHGDFNDFDFWKPAFWNFKSDPRTKDRWTLEP